MTSDPPTDLVILLPDLSGGGAERAALNLAGCLSHRGRRVALALFEHRGPLGCLVPTGVPVYDLGARRAATAAPAIARQLDAVRPRTLLSVMLHTNLAAAGGILLARHRPRFVWSVQNPPQAALAAERRPKATLMLWMTSRAASLPDAVVGCSGGVTRAFAELAPSAAAKTTAIYNPVIDPDRVRPRTPRASGAPPRLLAVGRLAAQKDYPLMLRALAELRTAPDTKEARLTILGDGPLRAELEGLVRSLGLGEAVEMPGFVQDPGAWMAEADVFVMSSAYEGLANVIPEAMAAGLPIVTTDWPPAAREVLEDGRWGRLVPLGDPTALARAIRETLADGGIDARPRARDFEIGRCADAYEAVLFPDG